MTRSLFFCRHKRRVRGSVPAPGESGVRVRWKRLVPGLPAASPPQALQYGLCAVPDEQSLLQMALPCRAPSTAGVFQTSRRCLERKRSDALCPQRMDSATVDQFLCCGASYRATRDAVTQVLLDNGSDSFVTQLQVRERLQTNRPVSCV